MNRQAGHCANCGYYIGGGIDAHKAKCERVNWRIALKMYNNGHVPEAIGAHFGGVPKTFIYAYLRRMTGKKPPPKKSKRKRCQRCRILVYDTASNGNIMQVVDESGICGYCVNDLTRA